MQLELKPTKLDELVRDIFADTEILAESSEIRVELKTCDSATVSGDTCTRYAAITSFPLDICRLRQPPAVDDRSPINGDPMFAGAEILMRMIMLIVQPKTCERIVARSGHL